ncbi:MAG: succinate--CoA ligase subunit alpha [Chloroflexi bacterium]|nr:MAG: succinate--CoA ligase subunit alpha [Chloroflexota bacterium]TMC32789.1 MAG: succinate--CoA ligase subunit alpha [Chloroflexota bacterium]TME39642.1 MAG: succinate--CoA ligase subunit alpha [Chloroflexota bacterium]
MSVLVGRDTRVVVQGLGREGTFHAGRMREYGTKVVAGTKPGAGGTKVDGIPLFDTVAQAVDETGANASIIFVPAPGAMDAMLEAIDNELSVVVCITEGTPVQDMTKVASLLERSATTLIGPNCPGLITPGECKIGIMPAENFSPGPIGFVSRSGTLTYEIADALSRAGLGQTTCLGIGGDPVIGLPTPEAVRLFNEDPATEVIVIVGEIGGSAEEHAAEYMRAHGKKPAVAFIAGRSAPPGKRMGHAGAIVSGNQGTAESKVKAFEDAGVPVANAPSEIPGLVKAALRRG